MRHARQLSFIHYFGAALLLTALTLCAGCAGGSSSTKPAIDNAGGPPPPKAIQAQGEKPVSLPDASPREGGVPLYVHLWDGGSHDPDGEIVKWEWNFSDAAPGEPAWQDYTATAGEAWHWYDKPGVKVAHLRVTDNDANIDVAFVKIYMSKDGNANPVAVASADPTEGNAPLTVEFRAAGSYDPDGTIVLYEWDFGEGYGFETSSSLDGGTTHVFETEGVCTVVLRVTDDDDAESMDSVEITVESLSNIWPMFGHDPQHTRRSPFTGPTTNALKWTYNCPGRIYFVSPAIGVDGTIYAVTAHGSGPFTESFFAFNPDGTLKWSNAIYNGFTYVSPAIGNDGTIYIGAGNKFSALNPDGTLIWTCTTPSQVSSSPVIGADGTVYIATSGLFSTPGSLSAIKPDGTLMWSYPTGGGHSSPAIGVDGVIYMGSSDHNLYAVKPDGTLKWTYTTGREIHSSPAVTAEGVVVVGSFDNNLYAINPDGTLKWNYTTSGSIASSPAIGADGEIYAGSYDGSIYAINSDGTLKWNFTVGPGYPPSPWFRSYVVDSSPSVGADGTVYVGSWETEEYSGVFYAINPDGTLKWSYYSLFEFYSAPAIASDGTVYVGDWYGNLYAIGPGEGV